jgi:hypothetical protein
VMIFRLSAAHFALASKLYSPHSVWAVLEVSPTNFMRPKRSTRSTSTSLVATAAEPAAPVTEAASTPKRRGRPPKSVAVVVTPGVDDTSSSPIAKRAKKAKLVEPSMHIQTNLRQLQPKALRIAEHLGKLYPRPPIPLDHDSHFQLLCAVVLSAQTTDKKVNEVRPCHSPMHHHPLWPQSNPFSNRICKKFSPYAKELHFKSCIENCTSFSHTNLCPPPPPPPNLQVTPALFAMAPDAHTLAGLDVKDIATCIKQLGLAPTKARNLSAMSKVCAGVILPLFGVGGWGGSRIRGVRLA